MYKNINEIQKSIEKGEEIEYLFFWGHTPSPDGTLNVSCLSQWYPCEFTIDGIKYSSAEQFMMAQKAKLFDDKEMFQLIIETHDPKIVKDLGRKVKNFRDDIWKDKCFEIVKQGNITKFAQNKEMRNFLLSTKDKVIVEASPRDQIWGIGMGKDNEKAKNPLKWRGENMLGCALMEARTEIRERLYET